MAGQGPGKALQWPDNRSIVPGICVRYPRMATTSPTSSSKRFKNEWKSERSRAPCANPNNHMCTCHRQDPMSRRPRNTCGARFRRRCPCVNVCVRGVCAYQLLRLPRGVNRRGPLHMCMPSVRINGFGSFVASWNCHVNGCECVCVCMWHVSA